MQIRKKVWFIVAGLIGLFLLWGLFNPNGVRAAFANNLWSLNFLSSLFKSKSSIDGLPLPPPSHAHGNLWLAHQALKSDDEDLPLAYLQPLIEAADPLALDTQAKILFNQGRYEESVNIWESTSNARSLEQARGAFIGLDIPGLIYRADSILYDLRPEEYVAWYAHSLNSVGKPNQSISILEESIGTYSNSDQKSIWFRLLGDFYRDQQQWTEAESFYHQAISTIPTDPKASEHLELMLRQKP